MLDAESGYKIEFNSGGFPPKQNKSVFLHKITDEKAAVIDAEIDKKENFFQVVLQKHLLKWGNMKGRTIETISQKCSHTDMTNGEIII